MRNCFSIAHKHKPPWNHKIQSYPSIIRIVEDTVGVSARLVVARSVDEFYTVCVCVCLCACVCMLFQCTLKDLIKRDHMTCDVRTQQRNAEFLLMNVVILNKRWQRISVAVARGCSQQWALWVEHSIHLLGNRAFGGRQGSMLNDEIKAVVCYSSIRKLIKTKEFRFLLCSNLFNLYLSLAFSTLGLARSPFRSLDGEFTS